MVFLQWSKICLNNCMDTSSAEIIGGEQILLGQQIFLAPDQKGPEEALVNI